jgi:Arc/MetJ-type ribon-helix-helix transcriptional regulator
MRATWPFQDEVFDAYGVPRRSSGDCFPGRAERIPTWYHFGMSKQIAVRLSDDLIEFVDEIVESGRERSRAAVVTRALERERRRLAAERDAEILAATGPDPDLVRLAEFAARVDIET